MRLNSLNSISILFWKHCKPSFIIYDSYYWSIDSGGWLYVIGHYLMDCITHTLYMCVVGKFTTKTPKSSTIIR